MKLAFVEDVCLGGYMFRYLSPFFPPREGPHVVSSVTERAHIARNTRYKKAFY